MTRKPSRGPSLAQAQATMDEIADSRARLNQTGADFLKVDVQTALTFCAIARGSEDPRKTNRNQRHARQGYETILRLLDRVRLSEQEGRYLKDNLEKLRLQLADLGEVLEGDHNATG